MATLVPVLTRILMGTTQEFRATIVDQNAVPVPVSALLTLTLTYYDRHTKAIINGRQNQPVLNANDVTMDSQGVVRWQMQPADTVLLHATMLYEYHIALFTWTWVDVGLIHHTDRHEVELVIERVSLG